MSKVISEKIINIECRYCGCIFEFSARDMKRNIIGEYHIKCPDCSKKIKFGFHSFRDLLNLIDLRKSLEKIFW